MEYPQIFSFLYVKELSRHPEHLRLPVGAGNDDLSTSCPATSPSWPT